MFLILLTIAVLFSILAVVSAYVISFNEYSHHFPNNRRVVKLSFRTAIVTFTVMIVLSFIVGGLILEML